MKAALISSPIRFVPLILASCLSMSLLHSASTPAQTPASTHQNPIPTQPNQNLDSGYARQFYAIASKSQLTLTRADGRRIVLNRCSGEAVINQRLKFLGIYYVALELACQSDERAAKTHSTIHIAAYNIITPATQTQVFTLPRRIALAGEARINGADEAIPITIDVRTSKGKSTQNPKDYTWKLRAHLQNPANPATKPSKIAATLLLTELK